MNKCKIIENGRLNKVEMLSLKGGVDDCTKQTGYIVQSGCQGTGTSYSQCPSDYNSCFQSRYMTCGSNYKGPTGLGGLTPDLQPDLIP